MRTSHDAFGRMCRGKARHRTAADARRAVAQSNRFHFDMTDFESYKCPFCSRYHIGHRWDTRLG
jgi:hypothetical protein